MAPRQLAARAPGGRRPRPRSSRPLRPSRAGVARAPRAARGSPRAAPAAARTAGGSRSSWPSRAGVLVDREAGAEGRDLEQHPPRLAEVDGAEVLPVDDPGGVGARRGRAPPPVGVVGVGRGPGHVVDRPGALLAVLGRRRVEPVDAAPLLAGRREAPGASRARSRAPRRAAARWHPGSRLKARTPTMPASACSAGISGRRRRPRRPVGRAGDDQLDAEPLGVGGDQRPAPRRATGRPASPRRSAQKSSDSAEPTRQTTRWIIPGPGRGPPGRSGISKKVRMLPGDPDLVAEVQVVHVRRVEVDRLLHQPKPHEARRGSPMCPGRRP